VKCREFMTLLGGAPRGRLPRALQSGRAAGSSMPAAATDFRCPPHLPQNFRVRVEVFTLL
jgi:hypothetical protein